MYCCIYCCLCIKLVIACGKQWKMKICTVWVDRTRVMVDAWKLISAYFQKSNSMRRRIQGYGRRIARKFRFSAEKFESSLMHSIIKCAITFHYLSNYPLLCNLHLPSGFCSLIFHLPKTLNLYTINWEKPLSWKITIKTLIKPSLYIQTLGFKTLSNGFFITQTFRQETTWIIRCISSHICRISRSTCSCWNLQQRHR